MLDMAEKGNENDLFTRINEQINASGVNLLCQIPINNEEYQELLKYTRLRAAKLQNKTIFSHDIYLSIAMVQIAIREYAYGNYWAYFLDTLDISLSQTKLNWLGQIFVATLKFYGLFEIERQYNMSNQYVENIKAHCFVPNNYLDGYFDFLFSFYDRNFFRQLPDDIESDIYEMVDYMAETISEYGDSIKLEKSETRHAKSYRLLKSTRCVIAQCSVITICEIIEDHLRMIDNYYYDGVEPAFFDRFSEAFKKWLEIKDSEINNFDKNRVRQSGEVFNHRPYFAINKALNSAYLIIPEQKFREQDFNGQAYVSISTPGGHTEKLKLDIYRAFGVLISEKCYISVNNIFIDYEIQIISGSIKSYSISAKHYRVFNENWYEIQRLRKGQCYILTDKHSTVDSNEQAIYTQILLDQWNEYSYTILDYSVVYINRLAISIAGEFSETPLFEHVSKEYKLFDENGTQIQTAYQHPIVSFKVNKQAAKGALLYCNEERFHIFTKGVSSTVEFPHDKDNIGVSMILNNLLPSEDGVYSIILDEPGKNRRIICKYVFIRNLRCRTDKRRFTFCETAGIKLDGNYEIEPRNCVSFSKGIHIVDLTSGTDQAEFTLKLKEQAFVLIVPLNVFKFGFSKQWIYNRPEYIWYTELRNDLYIFIPGANICSVYLNKIEARKIDGEEIEKNLFKFDISKIVQRVLHSSEAYHYINLRYTDNANRCMTVCKVLKKIWINKFTLIQIDGGVCLNIAYQGKAELLVRFYEQGSKELVVEKIVNNGFNIMPELRAEKLYIVERLMVESDEFGFSEKRTPLGGTIYKFGVINYSDLHNCKLIIKDILVNEEKLDLKDEYTVRNLFKVSEYEYTGAITVKSYNNGTGYVKKVFDQVLVRFTNKGMDYCFISVNENQDWVPMSYDSDFATLISSENELLYQSKDYSRFRDLYDDISEFKIEIRRDR